MEPNISWFICLIFSIYSGFYCISSKEPILSQWTSWASWTSCTRTCGTGIRLRQRICMNKRLSTTEIMSTKCNGVAKEYELCNLHRCPSGFLDFRSHQCNKVSSSLEFPLNLYKWVQVIEFSTKDDCSLICQTVDKIPVEIKVLSPVVMDSTPCLGRIGICINNECISIGCDNKLGSNLEIDDCGICGGDGTQCSEVKERFEKFGLQQGLYSVIKLPVGAGNIRIEKISDNNTNLAISNRFGGTIFSGLSRSFLLNGEEHQIGNSIIFYYHPRAMDSEILLIKESQNISVEIMVLVNKNNSHVNIIYSFMNPLPKTNYNQPELIELSVSTDLYQPLEIEFEYDDDVNTSISLPIFNSTISPTPNPYTWKTLDLTYCSSTCSIGITYPYAQCYNKTEVVSDSFCNQSLKPTVDPKLCAGRECNARWVSSSWGSCSASCGNGTQRRYVHCWKMLAFGLDSTVNKELCEDQLRPPDTRTCYSEPCTSQWVATEWSKCQCGIKTRQVRCLKGNCSVIKRPIISEICNSTFCSWIMGNWTECTEVCGTRTREITCQMSNTNLEASDICGNEIRPLTRELCSKSRGYCAPRWISQLWTKCSTTCDSGIEYEFGIKTRTALCMGWKKTRLIIFKDKKCRNLTKPELKMSCHVQQCQSKWFFSDWSKCSTSCNAGYRIRQVICYNGNSPATDCSVITRPSNHEWCNYGPCPR